MSDPVDLSKFRSNNELNKWICQVLGLDDAARQKLDHAELVQALGYEFIKTRCLLESVRNGLMKVGHGLVEIPTTVPEFAIDLVAAIDNYAYDPQAANEL